MKTWPTLYVSQLLFDKYKQYSTAFQHSPLYGMRMKVNTMLPTSTNNGHIHGVVTDENGNFTHLIKISN